MRGVLQVNYVVEIYVLQLKYINRKEARVPPLLHYLSAFILTFFLLRGAQQLAPFAPLETLTTSRKFNLLPLLRVFNFPI